MPNAPLVPSASSSAPVVLGGRTLRLVSWIWLAFLAVTLATFGRTSDLFLYSITGALLGALLLVALPGLVFVLHSVRHPVSAAEKRLRRSATASGVAMMALGVYWATSGPSPAIGIVAAVIGALVVGRALSMRRSDAPAQTALRHAGSTLAALVSLPMLFRMLTLSEGTKGKAYVAGMQHDLRTLVTAEEAFRADSGRFGSQQELLDVAATGDYITITLAPDRRGWWATALDYRTTTRCGIWIGAEPPDGMHGAKEGKPTCWEVQ